MNPVCPTSNEKSSKKFSNSRVGKQAALDYDPPAYGLQEQALKDNP
jgi:hypothetical protein